MDLETYRARQKERHTSKVQYRRTCWTCFQPQQNCYCESLRPFDSGIEFVILIHPIEARRRIATGRMSHLSLKNSYLFEGEDFSNDHRLTKVLNDPLRNVVMLYPGANAIDMGNPHSDKLIELKDPKKILSVVVIDGTWATARKMVRSLNLIDLPRVCFRPSRASRFRVRKQPEAYCYSTIEAIYQTIEFLGPLRNFDTSTRRHEALLQTFDRMVERQIAFLPRERQLELVLS